VTCPLTAVTHPPGSPAFRTTCWSAVLRAGSVDAEGRRALAELCEAYWFPLYSYLRRRGYAAGDAADLTQGYFTRLIEKGDLAGVDRDTGRFRAYLVTGVEHFAANERDKQRAAKRGGGHRLVSFDAQSAEARYRSDPADYETPARAFDRRWALAVLDQALTRLALEMQSRGAADHFARLRTYLQGDGSGPPYAEVAGQLGMTTGAIKVAVHRLRQRFRELLRAEICHTVADPGLAEAELDDLLAAVRR